MSDQLDVTACPACDASGRRCILTAAEHASGVLMHWVVVADHPGAERTPGFVYVWPTPRDPYQPGLLERGWYKGYAAGRRAAEKGAER